MMKKLFSEDSRRIRIFLLTLFLLVGFISIPLFALKAESGSGLVMAASVVFMWLPALATLITRKLTDDKSKLPLKPLIKKNRNDKIFLWRLAMCQPSFFICRGLKPRIFFDWDVRGRATSGRGNPFFRALPPRTRWR